MAHAIVVDIVETGKATGWAEIGTDTTVWGKQDGRTWYLFGGVSDEHKSHGSSLIIAVKRLAREMGLTGTAEIGDDRKFTRKTYDLATGKLVTVAGYVHDVPEVTTETQESARAIIVWVNAETIITGSADVPSYGPNMPITGRELDGYWYLYAGTEDEYNADDTTLASAVRKLADRLSLTGTAAISMENDDQDGTYVIDLGESAPEQASTVETESMTHNDGTEGNTHVHADVLENGYFTSRSECFTGAQALDTGRTYLTREIEYDAYIYGKPSAGNWTKSADECRTWEGREEAWQADITLANPIAPGGKVEQGYRLMWIDGACERTL